MNLYGVPCHCSRMGWVGQWQHLFWWRILFCKIQTQIPPKKKSLPGMAWRKSGLGGIPPRPSVYKKRKAPPSCLLRAQPRTKVFLSSQKKIGTRKSKIVRKTFLRGGEVSERRRGGRARLAQCMRKPAVRHWRRGWDSNPR